MPYIIVVFILTLLNLFFFRNQLTGKKIAAPDEINFLGTAAEIQNYYNVNNEPSLWTNSLFGGMPTYQIEKLPLGWTPMTTLKSVFGLGTAPMLYFFMGMSLLCFLVLCLFGMNPWLAGLGAFAFTYTSDHIMLVSAGHYTKLDALMFFPLLIGGMVFILNQRLILGMVLFALGLMYNLQANHLQMTYYIYMTLFIYLVVELVCSYQEKKLLSLIKPLSAAAIVLVFAVLANIAHLYTTYDYAQDTTRGKQILTQPDQPTDKLKDSGLDWLYATQFSNGLLDLVSMIIPGVVGGSSSEKVPSGSAIDTQYSNSRTKQPGPYLAPLYWGELPATSGPNYVGIISFVFFIVGAFYVKGRIKYWAVAAFIFLAVQSLGHNFILNRFLFEYVPFYNAFRTPNSILLVASAIIPFFGYYSLDQVLKDKWTPASIMALFKKTVFPILGFLFFMLLLGILFFDFSRAGDSEIWNNVNALQSTRKTLMIRDTLRALLLAGGASLALFLALKKQLKSTYFLILVAVLMGLDLWPVCHRYIFNSDYKDQKEFQKVTNRRNADQVIRRDRDLSYRVLDLSENTYNDAKTSMYHKSIGGYHPAKLRRYNDMIDKYLMPQHGGVLDMLNTKYTIDENKVVKNNPGANGNVWFVDTIVPVVNPDEEFKVLESINLKKAAAVLISEFPGYLDSMVFSPTGTIKLSAYSANKLTYQSNTSSPQVAVFSEIWYGPDKGWQAYIDGQPALHIRANYILRALKIPAGVHKIEFRFHPTKVWTLIKINRVILWLFFVSIVIGIVYLGRHSIKTAGTVTTP